MQGYNGVGLIAARAKAEPEGAVHLLWSLKGEMLPRNDELTNVLLNPAGLPKWVRLVSR